MKSHGANQLNSSVNGEPADEDAGSGASSAADLSAAAAKTLADFKKA